MSLDKKSSNERFDEYVYLEAIWLHRIDHSRFWSNYSDIVVKVQQGPRYLQNEPLSRGKYDDKGAQASQGFPANRIYHLASSMRHLEFRSVSFEATVKQKEIKSS